MFRPLRAASSLPSSVFHIAIVWSNDVVAIRRLSIAFIYQHYQTFLFQYINTAQQRKTAQNSEAEVILHSSTTN